METAVGPRGQRADEAGSRGKPQRLAEVLLQCLERINTQCLYERSQVASGGIFQGHDLDDGAGDGPAL